MTTISGIAYFSDFTLCSDSIITFVSGGREPDVTSVTDSNGNFSVELPTGTYNSDKVVVSMHVVVG